jgi:hypothetical protein
MSIQQRRERLMPNGIPKWIRCYDDGGETIDRYTVVYTKLSGDIGGLYVGMSAAPYHPQGVCLHGQGDYGRPIDRPTYGHLGKKIQFNDLPDDCRKVVLNDYASLWGLEVPA